MIAINLHCSTGTVGFLLPLAQQVFRYRFGDVCVTEQSRSARFDMRSFAARSWLFMERSVFPRRNWVNTAAVTQHADARKGAREELEISLIWCASPGEIRPDAGAHYVVFFGASRAEIPCFVGLSEVIARAPKVGGWVVVMLQGAVIFSKSVNVPTQALWSSTNSLTFQKLWGVAAWAIDRHRGSHEAHSEAGDGLAACGVFSVSHLSRSIWLYGALMAKRGVQRILDRVLRGRRVWNIRILSPEDGRWGDGRGLLIENPHGCFWADPFIVSIGGVNIIFVEEYVNQLRRGQIIALSHSGNGQLTRLGVCLLEKFHLSFPYVFEFDGRWWMCPESSGAGQIRLYVCDEFPLGWRFHSVLMENVSAADTMLFERDGYWWMLTNIDTSHGSDHCTELHVFRSATLLGGVWLPHDMNPVIADCDSARNGGFIKDVDGKSYRIAQRQAYDIYGAGYSVRRLGSLTLQNFEETECAVVGPVPPFIGAHHLSAVDGVAVSDVLSR
jgi:hypothetical protein